MPMSQWPCKPDSLRDIMEEDLIRYILAGAAEEYRLPIVIIDNKDRYDPFDPRQQASSFCRRLRGDKRNGIKGVQGADEKCSRWDYDVAMKALLDDSGKFTSGKPVKNSCWLKLNDYIVILSVASYPFVLLTGQLIRDDDKEQAANDIKGSIIRELSSQENDIYAIEQDIDDLLKLISDLSSVSEKMADILICAKAIQEQFNRHWILLRDAVEDTIYQDIDVEAHKLTSLSDQKPQIYWTEVNNLLANLCHQLGCNIAVLFTNEDDHGRNHEKNRNVLGLRASHGLHENILNSPPHFNWNKSDIEEYSERYVFKPYAVQISRQGIRGSCLIDVESIDLWHALSDDSIKCRTVIGLGGFNEMEMVIERRIFVDRLLSMVSRRIQRLQIFSEMVSAKEYNLELAEFLAHQVRSRLQTFYGYQAITLRYLEGRKTIDDVLKASVRLTQTLQDLATMAGIVHNQVERLNDPDQMVFKSIDPWLAIEAAIADQSDYADEKNIYIKRNIKSLPAIMADVFWLRIMLGHILNNAIKYSPKKKENEPQWIDIHVEHAGGNIDIYIKNFGLGIMNKDIDKVFEPGIRSGERGAYKGRSGYGRGLFEAKRIAHAHHGGTITIHSQHHSGAEVTPENINHCVTTVIISLPISF